MQDIKFSCTECGAENSLNESISAALRANLFAEFQKEFEDSHSEQFSLKCFVQKSWMLKRRYKERAEESNLRYSKGSWPTELMIRKTLMHEPRPWLSVN